MPTAIIADDEELPRQELRRMLADAWPELAVLAECEHGADALAAIGELNPDIAFLDIRMPGLSGLDVARAAGRHCRIVFVTAHDDHAFDAFEAGVIDYLRKPVVPGRLRLACERLRERAGQPLPDVSALMTELDRRLRGSTPARIRWISAGIGDTIRIIPIDDVLYFQSDDKYTRVVTANDDALVRTSLKELAAGLDPEEFWQVHRGAVVRASAIERIRRDELGKITIALKERPELLRASQAYAWRFRPM